ncbi:MAG: hypothetical protein J0I48_18995, partial [Devosia sp.]|nr:hypothetical protein [Devosia sp.]
MADPALQNAIMSVLPGDSAAPPDVVDPALHDPNAKVMEREIPTPDMARAAGVRKWQDKVTRARSYWDKGVFDRMRLDMRMARGDQWGDAADPNKTGFTIPDIHNDDPGARYVANVILRHIHSRTASIYGKNPKFVARRNKRLTSTVWDGNFQSLQQAVQTLTTAAQNPTDPSALGAAVEAKALIADAQATMQMNQQLDRIAQTLEILFEHEINEQPIPFKVQMKATVRRALTASVGYVKIGYDRVMGLRPEVERELTDMSQKLATLQRLAADVADGEVDTGSAEMDQLKSMMEDMRKDGEIVLREGLSFTFPNSTALIMDTAVQQLRGFVGAEWVAEEYMLTRDRIKEVYGVDVGGPNS